MVQFLRFVREARRDFRKLVNSGGILDTKIAHSMKTFLNYIEKDFDNVMKTAEQIAPEVSNLTLETVVSPKYKFLFMGLELNKASTFIEEIYKRLTEFKGKENNLKVLVSTYGLYFVLVVRLVEILVSSISAYKKIDPNYNVSSVTFDSIGISDSVFRNFFLIKDLRSKTIDEWISITCSDAEERYISLAYKRILFILGF